MIAIGLLLVIIRTPVAFTTVTETSLTGSQGIFALSLFLGCKATASFLTKSFLEQC